MDRAIVKKRIMDFEYYANGFHRLSGRYVMVRNLRLRKDKALADIIHFDYESNTQTRYNCCEYPYRDLDAALMEFIPMLIGGKIMENDRKIIDNVLAEGIKPRVFIEADKRHQYPLVCTGCGKDLDPDFVSKDTELTRKCHECLLANR